MWTGGNRPVLEVSMRFSKALALTIASLFVAGTPTAPALAQDQQPKVEIPQPGVPQVMTMEGAFVRAAYNNEGYAIIGYEPVNRNVGQEWVLLMIGLTVRDGVKNYTMTRDALSLMTPDGKTIPMATQAEYQAADLRAMERQSAAMRDSINYFPTSASKACRIGYFAEQGSRSLPYDQVELSSTRACLGRIYFRVPGGIQYGQHWLDVKFRDSVVRVPFRVLTKDEEKLLDKNYKSIEKQVKEAFAPKKKK
jgi:hypothetical protein